MKVRISRAWVFLSLLAVLSPLVTWAAGPPDTPIQVSLSSKAWTTVPLPATALGITEHDGVLWVAGADEMLARSDDQGHTWQIVHFKKGGELLFAVAFAGKDGWAMGSLGREFHSDDAGAHWKQRSNAPVSVMRLVAFDSRHLMASSPQGFLLSSNGGKSWIMKEVPASKQISPELYSVAGIAMPDANHAGALLELPGASMNPPQIFASTSDGGKTWHLIEFSNGIHLDSVTSDANGYKASGYRHLGTSLQSAMFHSADGAHWSSTSTPVDLDVRGCHGPECLFTGSKSWVQWDHGASEYWQMPMLPPMTNHWAAVPGAMCVVGFGLQCAQGQKLAAAPSEPAPRPASHADGSHAKAPGTVKAANCLRCAPPKYPQQDRANWISGQVLLHALIAKDGRVHGLTLLAAPSASLAQAAMQAVSGWIYQLTTLNGHPVEVDTRVTVNFTLNR